MLLYNKGMLNIYKNSYIKKANELENWKNMSINVLCDSYLDETDTYLKECYLSAIICRFWYLIVYSYYNQKGDFIQEDSFYDCLIIAISKTLEKAIWRNKNSYLYNQKDSAKRAIITTYDSTVKNMYKSISTKKRVSNYLYGNVVLDENIDSHNTYYDFVSVIYQDELIENYILKNDYVTAIILWSIINTNCIKSNGNYDWTALKKFIKFKLNDVWCKFFAINYDHSNYNSTKEALKNLQSCKYYQLDSLIKKFKKRLSKDTYIIDYMSL